MIKTYIVFIKNLATYGIFHQHNPSGRTMALGLTQPLTEMGVRSGTVG